MDKDSASPTGDLISYLDAADACALYARERQQTALNLCGEVDALFGMAAKDAVSKSQPPACALLNLNSRALYWAAVRIALSGHTATTFPVLRACLEAACYSNEIAHSPDLQTVWLARHQSSESMKACRSAFGKAVDQSCKRLGKRMPDNVGLVMGMYQSMIDDGAHPNVRSVLRRLQINETDTHIELQLNLLSGHVAEYALFCCFEIGLFTTWVIANQEPLSEEFWNEANRLNEAKNAWEQKMR